MNVKKDTSRIKAVREYLDPILAAIDDQERRERGFHHLYGTAITAWLLAKERDEDHEIAAIAALIHDIAYFPTGIAENHAHNGAEKAKEILKDLEIMNESEIELIGRMIYHHDDKLGIGEPMDELLKDADVMKELDRFLLILKNKPETDKPDEPGQNDLSLTYLKAIFSILSGSAVYKETGEYGALMRGLADLLTVLCAQVLQMEQEKQFGMDDVIRTAELCAVSEMREEFGDLVGAKDETVLKDWTENRVL